MTDINKHIVITGTGRAGTTFLIELFTYLGLDTGFLREELSANKDPIANAGLEQKLGVSGCPYIIKDPAFCDYAEEILTRDHICIEHIFVPIRQIHMVAASRRSNQKQVFCQLSLRGKIGYLFQPYLIPGGLWGTQSYRKGVQERILIGKLFNLLLQVSRYHTKVSFIEFPLMMTDPEYLYAKLGPVLPGIDLATFQVAFKQVVKPDLVHNYPG